MEQVRVTDAYYVNAYSKDIEYLLRLDPNRLLAGFKAVSEGKDPKMGVTLYGGWEGAWSLLRGHTLGHYLTAMAQAYKQTKGTNATMNGQVQRTLDDVITQLESFQDKSSNGYLFASPETHFDVVEGKITGDMWVPWYTMHKIIAGLVDVYKLEGNATALQIASKLGDWTYNRSSAWSASVRTKVLGVEYGGMNDCLYELYKATNSSKHLAAAHIFDEDALFTPISAGSDVLNGKHANTQIPKFIGALNRYRALGTAENFYYTAAQQFWAMVLKSHTYVTGGNSENEHFHVAGQLDSMRDNINNETCNSYNMLKLTRELFKITGDVKFADFYERAHLNEIMSAFNPTNGMTSYFKPMGTGYFKVFGKETDTFWCCNGTGMENYTKLNDSLYFHSDADLYVNLYLSSTLTWAAKGLSLAQTANLPLSNSVTFSVQAAPADAMTIKFRTPPWVPSCDVVRISVNGQAVDATANKGYLDVKRAWKAGDSVQVTLPMAVQVSRLPDNQNAVAFSYGPVVLSAGLGTRQMVTTAHLASEKATIPSGVTIKDTIAINSPTNVNDWIANIRSNLVQTAGKLEFTLKGTDSSQLVFTPHYLRYTDRYGIYFKLTGASGTASAGSGTCVPQSGSGGSSSAAGGSAASAGSNAGGASAGGTNAGGNSAGGANSGGASLGGSNAGGSNAGGSNAGGSNAGGAVASGGSSSVTSGGVASSASGGAASGAGGTIGAATGGALATNQAGSLAASGGRSSGAAGSGGGNAAGNSGCSCRVAAPRNSSGATLLALLGFALGLRRSRSAHRRRRSKLPDSRYERR
ncbi:MAG: glycoside hydrolase family 127 protein [Polyangiaceae bacterium]